MRRKTTRLPGRVLSASVVALLAAGVAQACPVCMLADPKTAGTYLGMTLMMSALPLGMLGGLIYWLKRRYSPPRYSPPRTALRAGTQAQAQPQHAGQLVAHHRV